MWDQRGAGKTDDKHGRSIADSISIQRMVADGLELSAYLHERLRKNKIVILGHSWGSILGVHMARERPELFSAYVGIGQFVNVKRSMLFSYPELVKRAEKHNRTQTLLGLRAMGPPPYERPENYRILIGVANALDPPVPQLNEAQGLASGAAAGQDKGFIEDLLFPEIFEQDLAASARAFQIPIVFIEGAEDLVTPDAKSYFDRIDAPSREFVTIPGNGHFAIFRAPGKVLEHLVEYLGT